MRQLCCRAKQRLKAAASLLLLSFFASLAAYNRLRFRPSGFASASEDGDGCAVPRLDPWDPALARLLGTSAARTCWPDGGPQSSLDQEGRLHLSFNLSETSCTFRGYAHNVGVDDDSVRWEAGETPVPHSPFLVPATFAKDPRGTLRPQRDFIRLRCRDRKSRRLVHEYHYAIGQAKPNNETTETIKEALPSILLLVIDSVSWSNAQRQLPKTLKFMEQELNGTTLRGYTKIDDNSIPNAVAMFLGKRLKASTEFPSEIPWYAVRDFEGWAWDEWAATSYATDSPVSNLFHLWRYTALNPEGFDYPPFDHYGWPFWHPVRDSGAYRRPCYGHMHAVLFVLMEIAFNYTLRLMKGYKAQQKPRFNIVWSDAISHRGPNELSGGDHLVEKFLRKANEVAGDDTVVILMSDHGNRIGAMRDSFIGRIEVSMPLMSIALPRKLREAHPHLEPAMRSNVDRLTTHYDLHATLRDILGGFAASTAAWRQSEPTPQAQSQRRAYSLFERVPEDRNCFRSNVPLGYCVCRREVEVKKEDLGFEVRLLATAIAAKVGQLLKANRDLCAAQTAAATTALSEIQPPPSVTAEDVETGRPVKGPKFRLFRVTVRLEPGGALVQGVVRREDAGGLRVLEDTMDRLNAYGNSSDCIHNRDGFDFLRKLCFCLHKKNQ